MDLALCPEDAAFRRAVIDFLAVHWPAADRTRHWLLGQSAPEIQHRLPAVKHWLQALVDHQWNVPHWPERYGGQPWSAIQRSIWNRESTRAMVPRTDEFAVDRLGPILHRFGSTAQCEQHLGGIREFNVTWHCAPAPVLADGEIDPELGLSLAAASVQADVLTDQDAGFIVNGDVDLQVLPAIDNETPHWCLIAAQLQETKASALLLLELSGRGIDIEPRQRPQLAPNSSRVDQAARVRLHDVHLPRSARLGNARNTALIWAGLQGSAHFDETQVASNRVWLDRLQELARAITHGPQSLWQDPDFSQQVQALEIAQQGHEVLEQRLASCADTPQVDALKAMLTLGCDQSTHGIDQLVRSALGYYALPDPDPRLLANEGPIGHEYAVLAMQGMLSHGSTRMGLSAAQLRRCKEIIAKSALRL